MNQTFNFQRLSLLIGNHWSQNRKRYLLAIAAMVGLLLVWFLFIMMTDDYDPLAEGLQQITFIFPFFGVGTLYASQFFKNLHSKSKGINYLMVPASHLEKLLCSLFYVILLFPLAFTAVYYLVDVVAVTMANTFHPSYNGHFIQNGILIKARVTNIFYVLDNDSHRLSMSYYIFLAFLAIQSAALLGSAYFAQYSFIKTAISLTLIFLLVALVENVIIKKMMPAGGFQQGITSYHFFSKGGPHKLVQLPKWIDTALEFLISYAFPPIFWLTTYFRLREKEI